MVKLLIIVHWTHPKSIRDGLKFTCRHVFVGIYIRS